MTSIWSNNGVRVVSTIFKVALLTKVQSTQISLFVSRLQYAKSEILNKDVLCCIVIVDLFYPMLLACSLHC